MNVAIIPARGGSKRIPKKNIKDFGGLPMISWSIKAAIKSNVFDYVLVSTDDVQTAKIAESFGAKVPFLRPKSLSDDYTPTVPVISHAINETEKILGSIDNVCCIYATAPFIKSNDILKGFKLLSETKANYVFPVTSYPFPIQRAIKLTKNRRIAMFYPRHSQTRSQDLIEAYHDAGQFYWGLKKSWVSGENVINAKASPIIIPRNRVQDIDTLEDWKRAELTFRVLRELKEI